MEKTNKIAPLFENRIIAYWSILFAYLFAFISFFWPYKYSFDILGIYYIVYLVRVTCITSLLIFLLNRSINPKLKWISLLVIPLVLWDQIVTLFVLTIWSFGGFAP